jgi:hypothetical protein
MKRLSSWYLFSGYFSKWDKFNVDIYYQEKDLINSGNKVKND